MENFHCSYGFFRFRKSAISHKIGKSRELLVYVDLVDEIWKEENGLNQQTSFEMTLPRTILVTPKGVNAAILHDVDRKCPWLMNLIQNRLIPKFILPLSAEYMLCCLESNKENALPEISVLHWQNSTAETLPFGNRL